MFQSYKDAREFLKRLGYLKQVRVLEGEEREKTLTMLRLMPSESSNNQRYWTESWTVGNISYELTTGEDLDELVEITEHDI